MRTVGIATLAFFFFLHTAGSAHPLLNTPPPPSASPPPDGSTTSPKQSNEKASSSLACLTSRTNYLSSQPRAFLTNDALLHQALSECNKGLCENVGPILDTKALLKVTLSHQGIFDLHVKIISDMPKTTHPEPMETLNAICGRYALSGSLVACGYQQNSKDSSLFGYILTHHLGISWDLAKKDGTFPKDHAEVASMNKGAVAFLKDSHGFTISPSQIDHEGKEVYDPSDFLYHRVTPDDERARKTIVKGWVAEIANFFYDTCADKVKSSIPNIKLSEVEDVHWGDFPVANRVIGKV